MHDCMKNIITTYCLYLLFQQNSTYTIKYMIMLLCTCILKEASTIPCRAPNNRKVSIHHINDVINFLLPIDITLNKTLMREKLIQELCSKNNHGNGCRVDRQWNNQADDIAIRSTCPWYYIIDHDTNRFPATILNAVLHSNTACTNLGPHFDCEKVYTNTTILQTVYFNNQHVKYMERKIIIPLGFACSRLSSSLSGSQTERAGILRK